MFSLISFNPFIPSPGLAIWGLLIFLLFWLIMGKVAFNPIAEALSKRENDIQDAIDQAKKTREEMVYITRRTKGGASSIFVGRADRELEGD